MMRVSRQRTGRIRVALQTLTWLADKLLERGRDRDRKARDQWDRVATYFDQIGETLEKMVASFKMKEIPRVEGNTLAILIQQFDRVVHSIYSPNEDADKMEVHAMLSELY